MSADNKGFFDELNKQIKAAGGIPDTFTVGGAVYQRHGTIPERVVKDWTNPRTGQVYKDCEMELITINPAPFADRIVIDGIHYMAGITRELPAFVCDQIREIMANSWRHEAQTGGANSHGVGPVRQSRGLNFVN